MRAAITRAAQALAGVVVALSLAACAGAPPSATAPAPAPVRVKVLAINDFHGHLKPPPGGIRVPDPARPGEFMTVEAGGAEHLATAIAAARAKNPNHIVVAAGDLVGVSPLLSAMFGDEPTIEALGLLGLEISAVGNHEFDKGAAGLLRLQNGGCAAAGCKGPAPFRGAAFQYLAASTVVEATGQTLLPALHVKRFEGIPVAFIGLTLRDTPTMVTPAGVAALSFRDEAETVNALVPGLRRQGIEAIVVLIHEGGQTAGGPDECPALSGAIVDIVKKFDRAVDVVVSGHTHRAYNCRIDGRLVTSADRYGTVLTEIDLVLDPVTRDVASASAHNTVVRTADFAKDTRLTALIAQYERLYTPLAQRVVARVAAPFPRDTNAAGESAVGQLVADAQLAATRDAGAQLAFMNPGGVRAALGTAPDRQVRFEDLYAVQPFANALVTMTLTGAQVLRLLEEQWLGQPEGPVNARVLLASRGFRYTWDAQTAPGQRVVPGSAQLNGAPIDLAQRYRVTVNSFMASGGDNYGVLKEGGERRTGMLDVDALEAFLQATPDLMPAAQRRIQRQN